MPINIVPVNWPGIAIEPGQAERTELRLSSNHSFNTNQLQCSCHRHVRVHCHKSHSLAFVYGLIHHQG